MADFINQNDIDSILRGTGGPAAAVEVMEALPYNFLRPHRISKDRRSTLTNIYTRFAVSMQALLSSRLRLPTDVAVASVEQATFGEFIMSLGNPCAAFVFSVGKGNEFQGVLDLSIDLSYQLIDRMFGGPGTREAGSGGRDLSRPLTQLERLVLKGVADRTLAFLGEVWEEHLPMQPTQVGFESMPEALQIANREDNVLVTNIDVRAGDFSGLLTVCLPLIALEAFLQEKRAGGIRTARINEVERQAMRSSLEHSLRVASLPVTARFPLFLLPARAVAALEVGQVIHTGYPLDVPLEVHVNGRRRFLGLPGRVRRALGVRITTVFPPRQADPAGRSARARIV
jgi:flagellar motor switch protein FliM